ncbi:hypothetical protein GM1_029_00530 [Gordonia malaquae NBRC 108250]|uniref:Uncharacterized protein n=1 Tax=Gordonia malaquae NBRC 108250 TaxID=1223542 RepID=M3UML4_GORML|nr:hypothetical protein GM1_029_00530 [Gordonia malaquae NBRC 108250]
MLTTLLLPSEGRRAPSGIGGVSLRCFSTTADRCSTGSTRTDARTQAYAPPRRGAVVPLVIRVLFGYGSGDLAAAREGKVRGAATRDHRVDNTMIHVGAA